jgi:16S rRNA (uracil1498-N3)-methyltransferase
VERPDRAPVATFHAAGAWGEVVMLGESAAHHVHVKRLHDGDVVRLTSGDGRLALGTLTALTKRGASVRLTPSTVSRVIAPPRIELLAPVGDRERMLLLAEKAVELGVTAWRPVILQRSRSVTPRGEGEAFREKTRLRMISALEQSAGAWLPSIHREATLAEVLQASAEGVASSRLLLDVHGPPIASLVSSLVAPVHIALGPEGGLEADERAAFEAAGWQPTSLAGTVLRFETAGIASLAVVRAHLSHPPA